MNSQILLTKFLELKYGSLLPINEVADMFHRSESVIQDMTFVHGRDHKRIIVKKNQKNYIPGENLEGYYAFGNEIMITESSIKKYTQAQIKRHLLSDRKIIENSNKSLLILGINGLGPLHQNREFIINLLNKGGSVKVLLLDPRSDFFEERVHFEKCSDNQITNRLIYEFLASVSLCKEISECCDTKSDIILKLYSSKPEMSLIIADEDDDEKGVLNRNYYPDVRGSRGMTDSSTQFKKRNINDRDDFNGLLQKYYDIFNSTNADEVDFTINPVKYLKYNPLV